MSEVASTLSDYRLPGDDSLFHLVNGLAIPWLDRLFITASSPAFGIGTLIAVLGYLIVSFKRGSGWMVVQVLVSVAITDLAGARLLKPFFGRLRPSFVLHDAVRVLSPASNSGSMPSLHAANAFAVAVVLSLVAPRVALFVWPIAVLIAISRVGVGVHWPSDIFAGALYGSAVAVLVVFNIRRITGTGPPPSSFEREARPM